MTTPSAAGPRYALFFVPPAESGLGRLGAAWFGETARPAVPGLADERLAALTEGPARYGFHATLKAPFRLAEGVSEADLRAAAAELAAQLRPVPLPPLVPTLSHRYLLLAPEAEAPTVDRLAARCVEALEPLRARLTTEERARRRPERLSPRERHYLDRYGYPYVFETYRFHLTLAGPFATGAEGEALEAGLAPFAEVLRQPTALTAITLVREDRPGAAFRPLCRLELGTASAHLAAPAPRIETP